jgi:DNA polymerase I-like protein with 3'-5' exonuclease and polymerase domains
MKFDYLDTTIKLTPNQYITGDFIIRGMNEYYVSYDLYNKILEFRKLAKIAKELEEELDSILNS